MNNRVARGYRFQGILGSQTYQAAVRTTYHHFGGGLILMRFRWHIAFKGRPCRIQHFRGQIPTMESAAMIATGLRYNGGLHPPRPAPIRADAIRMWLNSNSFC